MKCPFLVRLGVSASSPDRPELNFRLIFKYLASVNDPRSLHHVACTMSQLSCCKKGPSILNPVERRPSPLWIDKRHSRQIRRFKRLNISPIIRIPQIPRLLRAGGQSPMVYPPERKTLKYSLEDRSLSGDHHFLFVSITASDAGNCRGDTSADYLI